MMSRWGIENDDGWFIVYKDGVEVASSENGDRMADVYTLKARIAELEAERRWIPVSERLPEANKCVLIYDAGGNMTVDILVKSGGVETYFWLPKYRILFWMPLPEPPEVKG